jgi:hypothetical protein
MEPEIDKLRQRREGFLGLVLVLFCAGGFFLFLVVITGGFFLHAAAWVVVFALVGGIHYVLWGHALTREVAGEREEEEARERWENEQHPSPMV